MPFTRKMGQYERFGASLLTQASRTSCGQLRLLRAEERCLGSVSKNGLRKPGYENRVRKNKTLNQVQTNLRANSENVGPLTDNVVLRVFSGFFVPKRRAVSNVIPRRGITG